MASAFSITTTTNAIVLDDERRALVLFTVSNQTGRSVRVRTDVSPFPPTPPEWFSIEGETERLYPPGGAEAVAVQVAADPAALPGPYAFRLDAVSADRPDEEWAHGPVVGFEIAAPPPPPPPPPVDVPAGYVEALAGALVGALVAGLLSTIVGVIALILFDNTKFPFTAATFGPLFGPLFMRIYLIGTLVIGSALGGAIGAVTALVVRGIPDPAPWRTGLAFGALAMVVLTIIQIVVIEVFPLTITIFFFLSFSIVVPPESFAAMVIGTIVAVALLALIARAIGRFTSVGRL